MQRVLKDLADAIGLADAIEVCRRWGGRDLNVPLKVAAGDPLALTLGLDSARKLVKEFGGVRLQLPIERNALLDLRKRAIMLDYAGGKGDSQAQIGIEYGLTRQGVGAVIEKMLATAHVQQLTGTVASITKAESTP
jgi:hypothetical protein